MDIAVTDFPFWRVGALAGSLVPGLLIVLMLLRVGRRLLSLELLATAILGGVGIAFLPLALSTFEPAAQAHLDRHQLLRDRTADEGKPVVPAAAGVLALLDPASTAPPPSRPAALPSDECPFPSSTT